MNERIKELAEQAVKDVDVVYEDNPFNEELAKMYIPNVFVERFAELIIEECIQCINNRTEDWDAKLRWIFNDDSGYMEVNVDSVLKDHFNGVID